MYINSYRLWCNLYQFTNTKLKPYQHFKWGRWFGPWTFHHWSQPWPQALVAPSVWLEDHSANRLGKILATSVPTDLVDYGGPNNCFVQKTLRSMKNCKSLFTICLLLARWFFLLSGTLLVAHLLPLLVLKPDTSHGGTWQVRDMNWTKVVGLMLCCLVAGTKWHIHPNHRKLYFSNQETATQDIPSLWVHHTGP